MENFKYKTLFKAILEQIDLPDNAVIADLGCKDATFLLAFQKAFPRKIKSAIGVDITDKWFKDTMCNYHPNETIAENYNNLATLICNLQNWLYDNSDSLSATLRKSGLC